MQIFLAHETGEDHTEAGDFLATPLGITLSLVVIAVVAVVIYCCIVKIMSRRHAELAHETNDEDK